MNGTTPTTQDTPDKGRLQINLVSDISAYPIQGAQISIFYTGVFLCLFRSYKMMPVSDPQEHQTFL